MTRLTKCMLLKYTSLNLRHCRKKQHSSHTPTSTCFLLATRWRLSISPNTCTLPMSTPSLQSAFPVSSHAPSPSSTVSASSLQAEYTHRVAAHLCSDSRIDCPRPECRHGFSFDAFVRFDSQQPIIFHRGRRVTSSVLAWTRWPKLFLLQTINLFSLGCPTGASSGSSAMGKACPPAHFFPAWRAAWPLHRGRAPHGSRLPVSSCMRFRPLQKRPADHARRQLLMAEGALAALRRGGR